MMTVPRGDSRYEHLGVTRIRSNKHQRWVWQCKVPEWPSEGSLLIYTSYSNAPSTHRGMWYSQTAWSGDCCSLQHCSGLNHWPVTCSVTLRDYLEHWRRTLQDWDQRDWHLVRAQQIVASTIAPFFILAVPFRLVCFRQNFNQYQ